MRNIRQCIKPLRRALALGLALIFAGACALGETTEDLPVADFSGTDALTGGTQSSVNTDADLVVGYVAYNGSAINPFYCAERDLAALNNLVFESVVALDDSFQPTPELADSWTVEGKTWTFNLRSGISFHNGAPLTAADVLVSYQSFLAAGETNPYYGRIALIDSMEATGELTLTVTSKYPGYITLYAMVFPVVQASTVGDALPRGTGPYWYTQYVTGSGVRLEVNPLWWKNEPQLQSVAAISYLDSGDAIEALQTNAVDLVCTQSTHAALSRKLSDLTSMDYLTNTYEMLVPNLSDTSLMSDVRMRQAVMYAIDRATIVSNAYLGMGVQCEVPVNPSSWLYESQSAIYYYSPERAFQLIQEMGWQDLTGDGMLNQLDGVLLKDLTLTLVTYNEDTSSVRENAANLIAAYLANVGITVNVRVLSRDNALSAINNRNYDLALIAVNLSDVPNLSPLLRSSGALNLNRYSNTDMDDMIAATATVTTAEELKSLFSEIQMTVVNRLPILGLLFRTGTVLSSRSLAGLAGISAADPLNGIEFMTK